MTNVQGVHPWSDVAWDLARAQGIDPDAVTDELDPGVRHLASDFGGFRCDCAEKSSA